MRTRLFSLLVATLFIAAWTVPIYAAGAPSKAPEKTKSEQARDKYVGAQEAERKGQFQRAARLYQEATRLDPKYAEAFNQLGYVRRQLGLHKKALEAYDTALKLKPKFAEAHEYIARAHLALGNLDEAKAHHATLAELDETLAEDLAKAIADAEAAKNS